MPGVTSGKCNLYDHGISVPLVIRWPGTKPGRVIDDLVRLPDLTPTFLDIAGVKTPENLYGRSLAPLMKSDRAGTIDASRDWIVAGRERHVGSAREGNLPYPMRCLRTPDFLYIRNFMPDRWPMGSPNEAAAPSPNLARIDTETRAAYADIGPRLARLRWLERTDPEIVPRPDRTDVEALATLEDHDVTNQFSAFGDAKPGLFRRWLVLALLALLDYSTRHIYNQGYLTRVQTIHFARWVLLDDGHRMFFASNYDGSLESYMDDFINKVAWGINAVFGNGLGFPRTSWPAASCSSARPTPA